ncbi:MAG: EamA family transporter [Ignavibacteria bacterium]|nr:EamA family transporter [Ignavibacteria bacterium]
MKDIQLTWQLWAVLSAVFAACTAIFAKIGLSTINSDYATFIRTIVIVIVLAVILTFTGQFQPVRVLTGKTLTFLILSGLATGASWLCYFRALKQGEASHVAPIDKLSVVFVALFSVIILGEKISLLHWLGIALIAAGAVIIAVL